MESSREGATERKQGNLTKEGETRHSNPFLADGVLSKKADYIITHSTITRTELQIADPDSVRQGEAAAASKSGSSEAGQPQPPPGTAFPVEVEVKQTVVSTPDRQKAEEVQLSKEKKCKCCTVL